MSAFEQHMLAFPHDLKVEQLIRNALSTIDETLAAVHASKQRFEVSLDVPFYDLAVAVEARAREQALNRLLQFCPETWSSERCCVKLHWLNGRRGDYPAT